MEDLDKSNLVVAVLHIKDASDLLKVHEPQISDALLKLSKGIIEKNNLLSSDIHCAETVVKDISNATETT